MLRGSRKLGEPFSCDPGLTLMEGEMEGWRIEWKEALLLCSPGQVRPGRRESAIGRVLYPLTVFNHWIGTAPLKHGLGAQLLLEA